MGSSLIIILPPDMHNSSPSLATSTCHSAARRSQASITDPSSRRKGDERMGEVRNPLATPPFSPTNSIYVGVPATS